VLLNTVARPVKRLIGKEKDQSPSPIDTGASDCSRSSGDLAIRVSVVSQRASSRMAATHWHTILEHEIDTCFT
jgi:hypothetical protein